MPVPDRRERERRNRARARFEFGTRSEGLKRSCAAHVPSRSQKQISWTGTRNRTGCADSLFISFAFSPALSGLTLRLAALPLTLFGALVAASTGPSSRLVALGEDHISSQEAFVATSDDAVGSNLALLDGCASSSQFRVSDHWPPRRQRHHCRWRTKTDCQN